METVTFEKQRSVTYRECGDAILSIVDKETAQYAVELCKYKKRYYRNPCNFKKTTIVLCADKMMMKFRDNEDVARIIYPLCSDSYLTYGLFIDGVFYTSKTDYKQSLSLIKNK